MFDPLRRAFRFLSEYPEAGIVAEDVDLVDARRILMHGTQHYLYYKINSQANAIDVLGVWSTSRDQPLQLREPL